MTLHRLLIGTYTKKDADGIYWASFDSDSGALTVDGLAVATENPSFLARVDDDIYAVNENSDAGGVSAFRLDGGALTPINQQPSDGTWPCHLAATETWVAVSNYGSGSVAVFPRNRDGSIGPRRDFVQHTGSGPNQERQQSAHPHQIAIDPDDTVAGDPNRTVASDPNVDVVVPDLGADQLVHYEIDRSGRFVGGGTATPMASGSGPRHVVFHPRLPLAYVVNELSNTVTVLDRRPDAPMTSRQTIGTLPESFSGESTTAELALSADASFLHMSNRGHESVVTYAVDDRGELGSPSWVPTEGHHPRFFCLDPTGRWLIVANENSDNIVVYRLTEGRPVTVVARVDAPTPVCLLFV